MAFSKSPAAPQAASGTAKSNQPKGARPDFRFARRAPSKPTIRAEDVLAATDLVELISEVVDLRPRGDEMIGLCPFHGDGTPSFEVNGAKGIYSCWSCSAGMNGSRGGDALTFVRRYHGMSFRDALHFLAQRAGMPVPENDRVAQPATRPNPTFVPRAHDASSAPARKEPNLKAEKAPLYKAMETAQDLFSAELSSSPEIIQYLTQERGIDASLLGKYRIGYAPDSFGRLRSKVKDYNTNEALLDAGLIKETEKGTRYDFFRDRLMFAVRDDQGRIVAFGGRRIGEKVKTDAKGKEIPVAKYLNSPETAIFNKREVLYGWYEAKQEISEQGYVLMVEGYMDVLGLASQGVMNSAACMGTALTEHHIETILGEVKRIVFCFDGDRAGQEAGFRSLSALFPHLDNDVSVRFLTLADDLDPDEFVRKYGKARFLQEVNKSDDLPHFWEQALRRLYPDDKNQDLLWENAKELIKLLPKDSHHSAQLMQIASRLSGKAERRQRAPASPAPSARAKCSGLSSFVANEPSDRLYLAAFKMPEVASQMRTQLVEQQRTLPQSLYPAFAAWQGKYDQAMIAGLNTPAEQRGDITDQERKQYEAVVRAAPSILSQYLSAKEREMLDKALEAGELDEVDYLSKLRQSSFARPR